MQGHTKDRCYQPGGDMEGKRPPLSSIRCRNCGEYGHYPSMCRQTQKQANAVGIYEQECEIQHEHEYCNAQYEQEHYETYTEDDKYLEDEFDSLFIATFDHTITKHSNTYEWFDKSKEDDDEEEIIKFFNETEWCQLIDQEEPYWDCNESIYNDEYDQIIFQDEEEPEKLWNQPEELDYKQANLVGDKKVKWDPHVEVKKRYDDYLLDSGATCHVTNDIKDLEDIENISTNIKVAQNSICSASKRGKLELKVEGLPKDLRVNLQRVYFVKEFNKKIISIKQLTDDDNYEVTFKRGACKVKMPSGGTLKIGDCTNGLYYF